MINEEYYPHPSIRRKLVTAAMELIKDAWEQNSRHAYKYVDGVDNDRIKLTFDYYGKREGFLVKAWHWDYAVPLIVIESANVNWQSLELFGRGIDAGIWEKVLQYQPGENQWQGVSDDHGNAYDISAYICEEAGTWCMSCYECPDEQTDINRCNFEIFTCPIFLEGETPASTITKRPEQYFLISHWRKDGGDEWAVYESLDEAREAWRSAIYAGAYSASILSNCIESTDYNTVAVW